MGRVPIARAGLCVFSHLHWAVCLDVSRILVEVCASIDGFGDVTKSAGVSLQGCGEPGWLSLHSILLGQESESGVGIIPWGARGEVFRGLLAVCFLCPASGHCFATLLVKGVQPLWCPDPSLKLLCRRWGRQGILASRILVSRAWP